MADDEEKLSPEERFWKRWWEQDFSWAGLAALDEDRYPKRPWIGWEVVGDRVRVAQVDYRGRTVPIAGGEPATLQDYWRTRFELIEDSIAEDAISHPLIDADQLIADGLLVDIGSGGEKDLWHVAHLPFTDKNGARTPKADWKEADWATLERVVEQRLRATRPSDFNFLGRPSSPDQRAQLTGVVLRALSLPDRFERAPEDADPAELAKKSDVATRSVLRCTFNFAWLRQTQLQSAVILSPVSSVSVFFAGDADFERAAFAGNAWFQRAAFAGDADFQRAAFAGNAWFQRAAFAGNAWFQRAAFAGNAWFQRAAFAGDAWFQRAAFAGTARFQRAAFLSLADFSSVIDIVPEDARRAATIDEPDPEPSVQTLIKDEKFGVANGIGALASPALFNGAQFWSKADFSNRRFLARTDFGADEEAAISSAKFYDRILFHDAAPHGDTNLSDDNVAAVVGETLPWPTPCDNEWLADLLNRTRDEDEVVAADALPWPSLRQTMDYFSAENDEDREQAAQRLPEGVDLQALRWVWRAWKTKSEDKPEPAEFERDYRRLKLLMENAQARNEEQDFFALELRARRLRRSGVSRLEKISSYLFEWLSDFGRDLFRPMVALAAITILFAAAYGVVGAVTPPLTGEDAQARLDREAGPDAPRLWGPNAVDDVTRVRLYAMYPALYQERFDAFEPMRVDSTDPHPSPWRPNFDAWREALAISAGRTVLPFTDSGQRFPWWARATRLRPGLTGLIGGLHRVFAIILIFLLVLTLRRRFQIS